MKETKDDWILKETIEYPDTEYLRQRISSISKIQQDIEKLALIMLSVAGMILIIAVVIL